MTGNGEKKLVIGESVPFPQLEDWFDKGINAATLHLEAGRRYPVRVEYHTVYGGMNDCRLAVQRLPEAEELEPAARGVWLPPGTWEDLWTGQVHRGPATVQVSAPLERIPLFVRKGALVLLAPEMQHTGERPWDPLTVEAFLPEGDGEIARELYEDDGETFAYQDGACRRAPVTMSRAGRDVRIEVGPPEGDFAGALERRTWIVRVHLAAGEQPQAVMVNGKPVEAGTSAGVRSEELMPQEGVAFPLGGAGTRPPFGAGPLVEVTVPDAAGVSIELRVEEALASG